MIQDDLQPLSADLSEAAPAGANLEFDDEFGALERATQGKPEQQFGTTIIPAEAPDWREADTLAMSLLARTRDLRVLVPLAVARLHLSGLPAFAAVVQIIRQSLETNWAALHPQLDPEDDNDPTLRANALLGLANPGRVLKTLRDIPLAVSIRAGRISWRDIGIATGALELPEDQEKKTEAVLRAAFQDSDPARLTALREALAGAIPDTVAISAAFDANCGYGHGPDLSELEKLLRELARYIERYATGGEAAAPAEAAGPDMTPNMAAAPAGAPAGVSAGALTAVATRADALRLLDIVSQYYERYEPASPLPLLLDRARRLADKNFIDIMRDLAPDGLSQVQMVAGVRDE